MRSKKSGAQKGQLPRGPMKGNPLFLGTCHSTRRSSSTCSSPHRPIPPSSRTSRVYQRHQARPLCRRRQSLCPLWLHSLALAQAQGQAQPPSLPQALSLPLPQALPQGPPLAQEQWEGMGTKAMLVGLVLALALGQVPPASLQ